MAKGGKPLPVKDLGLEIWKATQIQSPILGSLYYHPQTMHCCKGIPAKFPYICIA